MEISKTSTGDTLFDLTSFVEVIPASHSQQPAKETELMIQDISGLGLDKPLANFDPSTQSWKMFEATLLSDFPPFLGIWPASGMTRNGALYQLPPLVLHIEETESLLWPTPRVTGSGEDISTIQERFQNGQIYKSRLEEAVALWPTPTYGKLAGGSGAFRQIQKKYEDKLITLEEKRSMQAGNGGRLNTMWVEWLMGFPLGWTDLED